MDKQGAPQSAGQDFVKQVADDKPVGQLRGQLISAQSLFIAQPVLVQRFLESQASLLAEAIQQRLSQVRFSLPDRVCTIDDRSIKPVELSVPQEFRLQMAGRLTNRLQRTDLLTSLHQRLLDLEHASNPAVVISAKLLRYTTAVHMVYNQLPAGRAVEYSTLETDDIPNHPVQTGLDPESAITAATDAIVEMGEGEAGRGELQVPYIPAARRFFLPQWIAFDEHGNLLVNSVSEAEAYLTSMQKYLEILKASQHLCHYIIADPEFQQKRYGISGQLVNQGRALAIYEVQEIIQTIRLRAAAQDLNRGLSVDLPYFDDQAMAIENWPMEIIPAGRIMFVPSFVVRAARKEQSIVQPDVRLSHSTRRHLLSILRILETSFEPGESNPKKVVR